MDASDGGDAGFAAPGVTGPPSEAQSMLNSFWSKMAEEIRTMNQNDFKTQELPLARIKKIMKLDEDVKMISAEAPVLFAKAAEMFVSELSLRAWIHTEENKRRTLQKNDISQAVSKYDQFDFLIDIVPRDEMKPTKREESSSSSGSSSQRASMMPDQVQYYFQLAQHHQHALQQQNTAAAAATPQPAQQQQQQQQQQTIQVQQAPVMQQLQQGQQGQQIQFQVAGSSAQQQTIQTIQTSQASLDGSGSPQIIQIQNPGQQSQQQQSAAGQQTTQVFQQIISPSGEVQNIPIQLSQSQLQAITMQMQGKQPGQPIVIQTNSNQDNNTPQQQQQQQFTSQQPIFQVPINIGGQQVYIQQDGSDLQEIADS